MKHTLRKTFFGFFFVFILSGIFSHGFANPHSEFAAGYSEESTMTKFYVSPNQIWITSKGIFVNLEEATIPQCVEGVFCDEEGLYVYVGKECKHGAYCPVCGGCHPNNNCQARCKCPPRR